ncbi:putative proline--tRNA ligase, mitochondrial [Halotydeus destructor]|nr:putative proline--tRNA ligase, mitochondrial [Halotydeus destructor]
MYVPSYDRFTDDKSESNTHSLSQLLLQANGCISSPTPGVFTILPYAERALRKLIKLIDKEMESIGGQKIIMPSLVGTSLWQRSGRLETCRDDLYFADESTILAPTHEEVVTQLVASVHNLSHKQLPIYLYQITSKFRKEKRPKGGLLRLREFLMKDLYTFDADEETAIETYKKVCNSYDRIFAKLELPIVKVAASTGEIGGQFSHEYHLVSEVGEDNLLVCKACNIACNQEVDSVESLRTKNCSNSKDCRLEQRKGIEVGHTFYLGPRYPEPFDAVYTAKDGKRNLLMMGCYGLGVTRLIAASLEVLSKADSMRWPAAIRPFDLALLYPKAGSKEDTAGGSGLIKHLLETIARRHPLLDIATDDRTYLTFGRRIKDHIVRGVPFVIVAGKGMFELVPRFEVLMCDTNETLHLTHLQTMDFVATIARQQEQLLE